MKFLIVFALALVAVSAFDLRGAEIKQRNIVVPAIKTEGRITNGQNADVSKFPYQVGLSLKLSATMSSWCGGSLIGHQWVLTAAHCTEDVQYVIVYLGATLRTQAEVKYTVSNRDIIIHPDWNTITAKNDISLIKIPSTAYSAKIKAVKLPSITNSYSTYIGDKVIASGWGRTSDASGITTNLQSARMEVISNFVCAKTFPYSITSSNICVSTPGGVSTCQGDSGGPLVLESSKVLVGVTSFGSTAGCTENYPAAFTRVTSYLKWISEHTGI